MSRAVIAMALVAAVTGVAVAGDREVSVQIAQKLRSSGRLRDYKVGVKYHNGTAWLEGNVASAAQMSDAVRLAKQVPSVKRVVNRIRIATNRKTAEADAARFRQFGQARTVAHNAPLGAITEVSPAPIPAEPIAAHTMMPEVVDGSDGMTFDSSYGQTPIPAYVPGAGGTIAPARYDQPHMPAYAWPSYAAYPNYAALTYPRQYSPTAWPFIGPFYPYPQVPLGWRKVTLEWDDGWWMLDFRDSCSSLR